MKRSLLFLALVASCLLGCTRAHAIEDLGAMQYEVVAQNGGVEFHPGTDIPMTVNEYAEIYATTGGSVEIQLKFRPTGGARSQVFYPLSELIREREVEYAHAIILESIDNEFALDDSSYVGACTWSSGGDTHTAKAVAVYDGPQIRSGEVGEISASLKLRGDLEPGRYVLFFRLNRVYDGAEKINEDGTKDQDTYIRWLLYVSNSK